MPAGIDQGLQCSDDLAVLTVLSYQVWAKNPCLQGIYRENLRFWLQKRLFWRILR